DHVYERAERNGVRYFVSGGGGAPLYPRDPHARPDDVAATIYFERTLNYLRVRVVGGFVEVAPVREDGTLIESVSWGALPQHLVAAAPPAPAPPPAREVVVASPVPAPASGCEVGGSGAGWYLILVCVLTLRRRRM